MATGRHQAKPRTHVQAESNLLNFAPHIEDQRRAWVILDLLNLGQPDSTRLAAYHYFKNLCRANWALEWNLPRWVGQPLGLDDLTQAELVEISAIGLMALRLQDDLSDHDLAADHPLAHLGDLLLQAVKERLLVLLPSTHPFWRGYRRQINSWQRCQRSGTWSKANNIGNPRVGLEAPAAPLLLSLEATCYLARHPEAIEQLAPAVKDYLRALILLDHANDWREDAKHGRHNRFVNWLLPEGVGHGTNLEAAVWTQIAHSHRFDEYLAEIERFLNRAITSVPPNDFAQLNAYLQALAQQTRESAFVFQTRAQAALEGAAHTLFSPSTS